MKRLLASAALIALLMCAMPRPAEAQATPFVGQVALFAFNFCPTGWLPLNGQLLPIAQNAALFSLLGTNYGGDGITTFALPKWGQAYTANGFPYTACIATQGVFPSRN
jgi:microcystin-dependent protein